MTRKSMSIRIRRCQGSRDCWVAVCGKHDFLMATSYSLDRLLALVAQRHPHQKIRVSA